MTTTSFRILPVYSRWHPSERVGNVRLLQHQVETLEAFRDENVDVVFNTAMTGDGKSLGALLPAFQDGKSLLAMYPTNELIRDQYAALQHYQERLQLRLPSHDMMFSAKITELMRELEQESRLETVRNILNWNSLLLTNPDLVHLMMTFQYGWGHARKELPYTLTSSFDYLLFDEFHVFDIPQVIAVTNMLGYFFTLYKEKPERRRKFVLLSATPSKFFDTLLRRGGIRTRRISGSYRSSAHEDYHRILQPCKLELHEIGQERRTEQWVVEHMDEIRCLFTRSPKPKGAILVNSVATARRLVSLLKTELEAPHGITIGENTGLTDAQERRHSFEKDLLVGTSTVDVGVDFRINLLIFEAFDAGTFVQRFGRLGRHSGFESYHAYALVPRFVRERFEQRFPADAEIERESFNVVVQEVFPQEAEFRNYAARWGGVQAAQVVAALRPQKGQTDESSAFADALMHMYEQLYGKGEADMPVMKKNLNRYYGTRFYNPEIIKELGSFRGQSPLSCGVWDLDGHVQTYDLFFLLANTRFYPLEKEVFLQQVRARQGDEKEFEHQLLYLRIEEYLQERQSLVLYVNKDLALETQNMHKVLVWDGITVLDPPVTWLDQVNRRLRKQKLVCIISDIAPDLLKPVLHLGAFFQVLRLQDKTGARNYSLLFGQEALLVDTELHYRKVKSGSAMML
jgi:CRISPR-associated endonuclease/helicase Cas3